jgi:hypothetical protein
MTAAQTVLGIEFLVAAQGIEWRLAGTDAGRLWHEPDAPSAPPSADVTADARRRLERFARSTDASHRGRKV